MKSKFFPQIKNLIRFSKLQKSDTGKSSLIQQKRVEKIMHLNVKFPRTGLYPEGVKNKIAPDVDIVLT